MPKSAHYKSLKVALLGNDLAQWAGGNDFLRLCAGGLWQEQLSSRLTFSLFFADETSIQAARRHLGPWKHLLGGLLRLETPRFTKRPPPGIEQVMDSVNSFGRTLQTTSYQARSCSHRNLIRLLQQQGYDAIMPFAISPGRFPLPWVGYIPDLQHKHHPEFFSAKECTQRDLQFTKLLRDAKAVIVNSRDAKRDLRQFYPGSNCAIFNLPFAPILNPAWLEDLSQEVVSRYGLCERYFLISNQFWAHKSHLTAFEALSKLHPEYAGVSMVCTGSTTDYRQPEYFFGLQQRIAELGLQSRILVLGRIPKEDQIQIMRRAVMSRSLPW